jgi:hypothetical protein
MVDQSKGWLAATRGGGIAVALYYAAFTIIFMPHISLTSTLIAFAFIVLIAWLIGWISVMVGMLFVGLPVTCVLRHANAESVAAYSALGTLFGLLIPTLIAVPTGRDLFDEGLLAIWTFPGTLAGLTAGYIWGRWRITIAADVRSPDHPNRYHDERILR